MTILLFILAFLIGGYSETEAQTYKYIDKNGTVCFTQDPKKAELQAAQEGSIEVHESNNINMNSQQQLKRIIEQTLQTLTTQCQEYNQDPKRYARKRRGNPCEQLISFMEALNGKKMPPPAEIEEIGPPPQKVEVPGYYIKSGKGYIGPDGFSPDLGAGIINPRTGEYMPKVGGGFIGPGGQFNPANR